MSRPSRFADAIRQLSLEQTDLQSLLGPPPLLEGEDVVAYNALKIRILSAVKPEDAIEEICVLDYLDLCWETARLRRLKAKLMRAAAYQGVEALLHPLGYHELAQEWALGYPKAVKKVKQILGWAGLDEEAIAAQTLAVKIDAFEKSTG
jgi:hypothetical protein